MQRAPFNQQDNLPHNITGNIYDLNSHLGLDARGSTAFSYYRAKVSNDLKEQLNVEDYESSSYDTRKNGLTEKADDRVFLLTRAGNPMKLDYSN